LLIFREHQALPFRNDPFASVVEYREFKVVRMSSVMKPRASPSSAPRLGVIHFLLWMLGSAAALTGFRVMTNWSEIAADDMATVRATHLGMSMAYGMASVDFGAYVWFELLRVFR
jgi:hypothetical protein